jgi:hypothetical protein
MDALSREDWARIASIGGIRVAEADIDVDMDLVRRTLTPAGVV